MNATLLTRWLGATAVLVALALADQRYGHVAASGLLIVLLLAVAIWGGHGRART